MNLKKILLLAGLLVVSFGVSFGLSWWLSPSGEPAPDAGDEDQDTLGGGAVAAAALTGRPVTLRPDERATDKLRKELRDLLEQNKNRARKIEEDELRLARAKAELALQAKELEGLRVKLVAPLDRVRQEMKALEATRIRIQTEELANLRFTAGIYDKMAAEESGPIIKAMIDNGQLEDAVKILRYMTERVAAKVLAEVQRLQPDPAGNELEAPATKLSNGLKRLQQQK